MSDVHAKMMARAIELGHLGDPSPNPHVGCVIARALGDDLEIVGEGHHESAGEAHAEILALREAGDRARGATAYVTLEPCNHQGRTPPCVSALIETGIKHVVIGSRDPNPHVEGGGVERLEEAGIQVTVGVLEEQAQELIESWTHFITTGETCLSLKLALSLDGRIASRTGVSKWITCSESRAYGHKLRAGHDAVMVGLKTVLADDPRLTVRALQAKNPIRVVVDSKLRLPLDRKIVKTAQEIPTVVLTTDVADQAHQKRLEEAGLVVIHLPATSDGRCDMRAALQELAQREVVSVLCEGGAELAGSLLAGQLVHRLHAFVAPLLLGPRGLAGAADWAGPESPELAPRLIAPRWELHGNDAYVTGRVAYDLTDLAEWARGTSSPDEQVAAPLGE